MDYDNEYQQFHDHLLSLLMAQKEMQEELLKDYNQKMEKQQMELLYDSLATMKPTTEFIQSLNEKLQQISDYFISHDEIMNEQLRKTVKENLEEYPKELQQLIILEMNQIWQSEELTWNEEAKQLLLSQKELLQCMNSINSTLLILSQNVQSVNQRLEKIEMNMSTKDKKKPSFWARLLQK